MNGHHRSEKSWKSNGLFHFHLEQDIQIAVKINSTCPHIFDSSNWILESSNEYWNCPNIGQKIKIWKEKLKVDMVFQSFLVRTQFISFRVFTPIFEHSIWIWTIRYIGARAVYFYCNLATFLLELHLLIQSRNNNFTEFPENLASNLLDICVGTLIHLWLREPSQNCWKSIVFLTFTTGKSGANWSIFPGNPQETNRILFIIQASFKHFYSKLPHSWLFSTGHSMSLFYILLEIFMKWTSSNFAPSFSLEIQLSRNCCTGNWQGSDSKTIWLIRSVLFPAKGKTRKSWRDGHIFEKLNSSSFPWDFWGILKFFPEQLKRGKFDGMHFCWWWYYMFLISPEFSRFFSTKIQISLNFPEILTIFQIPWVFQVFSHPVTVEVVWFTIIGPMADISFVFSASFWLFSFGNISF